MHADPGYVQTWEVCRQVYKLCAYLSENHGLNIRHSSQDVPTQMSACKSASVIAHTLAYAEKRYRHCYCSMSKVSKVKTSKLK